MQPVAKRDLYALKAHADELENRVRNLQNTVEKLRSDFAEAVLSHHQRLEQALSQADDYYGLPTHSVPLRAGE